MTNDGDGADRIRDPVPQDLNTQDLNTQDLAAGELSFPRAARLELDDLLEQLVARARDVQETQGRLRGLLRAYLTVASAVDLENVLRHIVTAARELVSARYAALGVIREGRLVQFVHEGMDAATIERIGAMPEGKGLLGRLMDYPQPLRLADIDTHLSSVGFPDHHPPMKSFLGVPIQVGDRVFGNLYLTDKHSAIEFSPDDQELAQALAAAAGLAIENARLFDQVRRGHDWQNALVEITTALLSGADPEQALRDLVRHAQISANAVGAGISVPTNDDKVRVTVAEGTYRAWLQTTVSLSGSIAGAALSADCAIQVADPTTDVRFAERIAASGAVGPTLAVPIAGTDGAIGVLSASRSPGDEPFDDADQKLIGAFASRAGLALNLAAARRRTEEMHLIEDRGHIAEQLREHVISRLFAAGLSVQAILPRVTNPAAHNTISKHIDEIDAIIADIRKAVFAIVGPSGDPTAANRADRS